MVAVTRTDKADAPRREPGESTWLTEARRQIADPQPSPVCLQLSPDGRTLAVGTKSGRAILRHVDSSQDIASWETVSESVRDSWIHTFDKHASEHPGDLYASTIMQLAAEYRAAVHCLAFSPEGAVLAVGTGSGSIQFHTSRGRYVTSWSTGTAPILALRFHEDGRHVGFATPGQFAVRNLFTEHDDFSEQFDLGLDSSLYAVAPDLGSLAVVKDGNVVVHHAGSDATYIWWGQLSHDRITALTWSADSTRLAVANEKGVIQVWIVDDEPQLTDVKVLPESVCVRNLHAANGELLALTYDDDFGGLTLWNAVTGSSTTLSAPGDGPLGPITTSEIFPRHGLVFLGMATGETFSLRPEETIDP